MVNCGVVALLVLLHLLGERRLRWDWGGVCRGQVDQSTGICMYVSGGGGLERSAPSNKAQTNPNRQAPATHIPPTYVETGKGYIQKTRTGRTHLAAHLGLQRGDLLQDDAVLLLLGAGLPDGLECGTSVGRVVIVILYFRYRSIENTYTRARAPSSSPLETHLTY